MIFKSRLLASAAVAGLAAGSLFLGVNSASAVPNAHGPAVPVTENAHGPAVAVTENAHGPAVALTENAHGPAIALPVNGHGPMPEAFDAPLATPDEITVTDNAIIIHAAGDSGDADQSASEDDAIVFDVEESDEEPIDFDAYPADYDWSSDPGYVAPR